MPRLPCRLPVLLTLCLLLPASIVGQKDVDVDHYAALGIQKSATQKEIRSAYKKLSLQFHPDKHAGKDTQAVAQDRFAEVSAAYEVLGDEDKRNMYDSYGGEEFYNKYDAEAAGANTQKGFFDNSEDITKLRSWMFKGWKFNGQRAKGPLSKLDKWVFDFYTPWCVHCQHMAPHFRKAARRFSGEVGFAAANCEEFPDVCQMWNIRSYPTLFFVGQEEGLQEKFTGSHDAEGLIEFVKEMSIEAVETLTPRTFETKVYGGKKPSFVLFNAGAWCGPCTAARSTYRRFGAKVHEHALVATIECDTYGDFCSEMGVTSYPHYRSFVPGDSRVGDQLFSPREVNAETALELIANTVKMMALSRGEGHWHDYDEL